MAAKKRANKKSSARGQKKQRKRGMSRFSKLAFLLLVAIGACSAAYHFGSFTVRTQMEHIALQSISAARSPDWLPRPMTRLLNLAYDQIPGSEGLVVEGGEIGHDDSPFIAGLPESKLPIRILRNQSYSNLFDPKQRLTTCVALQLSPDDSGSASTPSNYFEDPRIESLRAADMQLGQWLPKPIAPANALANTYGDAGANEAHLTTNLAPMSEAFYNGIWQQLMYEITVTYPKRFGQTWIYLGPVIERQSSAKLNSGIPIPNSFYAIVFNLTEIGGLRAIAFLLPQDQPSAKLSHCITSIAQIEQQTGLRFLPDVEFHARKVLGTFVSPQLW
jgi:endonuclease G